MRVRQRCCRVSWNTESFAPIEQYRLLYRKAPVETFILFFFKVVLLIRNFPLLQSCSPSLQLSFPQNPLFIFPLPALGLNRNSRCVFCNTAVL